MKQEGLEFKKNRWWDSNGDNIKWKVWWEQTFNQDFLDLANDIFLNILFQDSKSGQPLDIPFIFNRHKIMHGEQFRYGRTDNTIRAFLILDFLASLKQK